jgi:hypothetical protein
MDGAVQFRSGLTAGAKATLRGSAGGPDPVKILAVADHRASPLHYLAGGHQRRRKWDSEYNRRVVGCLGQ